jgi:hypothetical protein
MLIDLSMIPRHPDHFVCLNEEAKSNIKWWVRYYESWNRIQMMCTTVCQTPAAVVTSDASGSWSCEA